MQLSYRVYAELMRKPDAHLQIHKLSACAACRHTNDCKVITCLHFRIIAAYTVIQAEPQNCYGNGFIFFVYLIYFFRLCATSLFSVFFLSHCTAPVPSARSPDPSEGTAAHRRTHCPFLRPFLYFSFCNTLCQRYAMLRAADSCRFLGRVKPNAYRRARRSEHLGTDTPAVAGSLQAYASSLPAELQRLGRAILFNSVKVCPACAKPNGHTLQQCNKCRTSLTSVGLSETPNLFAGFLLGLESAGRIPLRISLRHEERDVMVFDDPLSLAPLHFCAVPTAVVIPDWRFLTLRPADGLRVHHRLLAACHDAARREFFNDALWRTSLLSEAAATAQWEWHMVAGYNYPPSQNQLHIQYMSPALMPHQHMLFCRGVHFTPLRFFPVDYVVACLEGLVATEACCSPADLQLPIEDFVALLEQKCGVSYSAVHSAFMEKVAASYSLWSSWLPDHFEGEYVCGDAEGGADGRAVFHSFNSTAEGGVEVLSEQAVFDMERKSLENYGVSANLVDRSLGFYSFSRALQELDMTFLAS